MMEKKQVHFAIDSRWRGPHGIGRFAEEMERRLTFCDALRWPLAPSHPLDVVVLTWYKLLTRRRLLYSPGYNAPFFFLNRYVFTVHDLNHIDLPGTGWLKKVYYHLVIKRACRRALKILTVSEYSRQRIADWAGIPASHIVNVGNGVGDVFTVDGPAFSPGFKYFLCVSNRKTHKNEERMLTAFANANICDSIRLVVTGEPTSEITRLVAKLKISDRVIFVGELSDDDLAQYYRGALALVFVSLYEGFGLPIVEAMSCGTPVLTGNVTAMPEVAGDGALMVDPMSVFEISMALEDLVGNRESIRERLREHGLERSQKFLWCEVAERVYAQLERIH